MSDLPKGDKSSHDSEANDDKASEQPVEVKQEGADASADNQTGAALSTLSIKPRWEDVEVVWAKFDNYPWWPSQVTAPFIS